MNFVRVYFDSSLRKYNYLYILMVYEVMSIKFYQTYSICTDHIFVWSMPLVRNIYGFVLMLINGISIGISKIMY